MTKSINAGAAESGNRRQRRRLHLLTPHDAEKLALFYLGLDFDGRRERFGAGISDSAITRYCQTLDWQRSVILGRTGGYLFDAILELHPPSPGWDSAEIVLSCPLLCDTAEILSQLIQLAALLAGQNGCRNFLVIRDGCRHGDFALLGAMGAVRSGPDQLTYDVAGYVLADAAASCGRIMTRHEQPFYNKGADPCRPPSPSLQPDNTRSPHQPASGSKSATPESLSAH